MRPGDKVFARDDNGGLIPGVLAKIDLPIYWVMTKDNFFDYGELAPWSMFTEIKPYDPSVKFKKWEEI